MAVAMSAAEQAKTNAWNAGFDANYNRTQAPAKSFSGLYPGSEPITSVNPNSQVITSSTGGQFVKLPPQSDGKGGGYMNVSTGERVSGISLPAKSNVTYSSAPPLNMGGGGGSTRLSYGSVGGGAPASGGTAQNPLEFYLGAAPTLEELQLPEYAGVEGLQLPNTPVIGDLNLPNAPELAGVDYSGVMDNFRSTFDQLNRGVNPNFETDQNKLVADAKEMAAKLNLSPEEIKKLIAGINPSSEEIAADYAMFADTAASSGNKIAAALNEKYQNSFESAMPGYKANMAKANELTSTYLSGKLPQSVVDATVRGAAAKGFTTGLLGGGIGRNIVARDLGLTSLQLQSAGANLLQQTSQIANSVLQATMPVTGAQFADPTAMFSASMSAKRVDPSTIFNAVYTPVSQVYNQMGNMAQQSTMARASFEASKMIQPGAVLSTLTQQALYNQQIDMQNQLNNWENSRTMATQNQQIAEKNAMNQWGAQRDQALFNQQLAERTATTRYDVDLTQAQYNQQIRAQNLMNAYQSQALPGQFDISKGKYVGYQPGTYSDTKPTAPSAAAAQGQGLAAFNAIDTNPRWTPTKLGPKSTLYQQSMSIQENNKWQAEKAQNVAEVDRLKRDFQINQANKAAYG